MINIKNEGNPVYIGKQLCGRGVESSVDAEDLKKYLSTVIGAIQLDTTIFVIDQAAKDKVTKDFDILKTKAMAECRQELGPVIEREITEKLEKRYQSQIESLEQIISDLKEKLESPPVIKKDENTEKPEVKDSEKFVFDPEIHHVEHRGNGKWFVMEKEERVYGPLTEEEKKEFDETMTRAI